MADKSVKEVFAEYQEYFNGEQETREKIRETTRELEKNMKLILGNLQGIHQNVLQANLEEINKQCVAVLNENIKPLFEELDKKIPSGEYFRYNDQWRFLTSRLAFACALMHYISTDQVASRDQVAAMLGLPVSPKDANLYLDLDDYLQGLLTMSSELSRFSINCVAKGDTRRPKKIFKTLSDLQQAFSELNLKNDHLRRMFDGLKYDVKKVEQVMYDITIRGLDTEATTSGTEPAKSGE